VVMGPDGAPIMIDGVALVVDAINPSFTDFGTNGEGIFTMGHLMVYTNRAGGVIERVFVIANVDLRSIPGYDREAAQWPLHQPGSFTYTQLGGYNENEVQVPLHLDSPGANAVWNDVVKKQVITDYVHAEKLFHTIDAYLLIPEDSADIIIPTAECDPPA
jgi:hypothetical protein